MNTINYIVAYILVNTIYLYDAPNWVQTYIPVLIGFFN